LKRQRGKDRRCGQQDQPGNETQHPKNSLRWTSMISTHATGVKATPARNIDGIISRRRRTPQCQPLALSAAGAVKEDRSARHVPALGTFERAHCYRARLERCPGHCPADRRPEAPEPGRQRPYPQARCGKPYRFQRPVTATTTEIADSACASGCSRKRPCAVRTPRLSVCPAARPRGFSF